MRWRGCIQTLAVGALLLLGACTRAGFGARGDRELGDGRGPRGDLPLRGDWALPPRDSCASPPYPTPEPLLVTPAEAHKLADIIAAAEPGTTIALADGIYAPKRPLVIERPGITLRSQSRSREAVVIDGEYLVDQLVYVGAASVRVWELTLRRATDHLVRVDGVVDASLFGLVLEDAGLQAVKASPSPKTGGFADGGRLECSVIRLTEAGRDAASKRGPGCGGGVVVQAARGWALRMNRLEDLYCDAPYSYAMLLSAGSRDSLVERNKLTNVRLGIFLGLGVDPVKGGREYPDNPCPAALVKNHIGGVVRANVIHVDPKFAAYDTGIGLEQACGAKVHHNTLVRRPAWASIDLRYPGTRAEVRNNLLAAIKERDGTAGNTLERNLAPAPLSLFVAPDAGDYRLLPTATEAIDRGAPLPDAGLDIDGAPRGPAPDLGAYER